MTMTMTMSALQQNCYSLNCGWVGLTGGAFFSFCKLQASSDISVLGIGLFIYP